MTSALLFLAAASAATPLPSPYYAPPPPYYAAPAMALPRELGDPAMADRIGHMMGAMARAVMNLPVGEVEAAAEGRPATRADRSRKVRDVVGADDRHFAANVEHDSAATGRAVQGAARALIGTLPAIVGALRTAESEIDRAAANLPDPTYPRR